jgi:hypothetical protein
MVKLVLLQLSLGVGGKPLSFAPHVWKTLLDLRLLDVPFEDEWVTSAQLESELPKRFGLEKVTIPVSLGLILEIDMHLIFCSADSHTS